VACSGEYGRQRRKRGRLGPPSGTHKSTWRHEGKDELVLVCEGSGLLRWGYARLCCRKAVGILCSRKGKKLGQLSSQMETVERILVDFLSVGEMILEVETDETVRALNADVSRGTEGA
jgi:hypothetical protein